MREILFRGKRKDNGEWIEGFLILKNGRAGIVRLRVPELTKETADEFIKGYRCFDVIPETVGQYTGLTDKNGKKIFEEDIVQYNNMMFEVKFVDGFAAFDLRSIDNMKHAPRLTSNTTPQMEVIGNIHDNPEQLEVQT